MHRLLVILIPTLILVFLQTGHPVLADEFEWTGGAGTLNWNDAGNWLNTTAKSTDEDGIPDENDDVTFVSDTTTRESGAAYRLVVDSSVVFTIDNSFLDIGNSIVNLGTITFQDDGSSERRLYASDTVSLTGGGEIVLVNVFTSTIQGSSSQVPLINVDNTIRGTGYLNIDIVNQSLIRAENSYLVVGNIDNTNGQIEVSSNGILELYEGEVIGGLIAGVEGAQIRSVSNNWQFKDLTLAGSLTIDRRLALCGNITNNGTLSFEGDTSTGADEFLIINDDVVLSGNGELILLESTDSEIYDPGRDSILTNSLQHVIRGAGVIEVELLNEGTVRAENGELTVWNVQQAPNGVFEIAANGVLRCTVDHFEGGSIHGVPGSFIKTNNSNGVFRNFALDGQNTVDNFVEMDERITNRGQLFVPDNAKINFLASSILEGGGEIVLGGDTSLLDGWDVNNVDNTIRGFGEIDVEMDNDGVIVAEDGVLVVDDIIDNSDGVIRIASSGNLELDSGVVLGGTIIAEPGATLSGNGGGTLRDVELDGDFSIFGRIKFAGTVQHPGTMSIIGESGIGVNFCSFVGGGEIILNPSMGITIGGGSFTSVDNLIRGSGEILADMVNQHILHAEGGTLFVADVENSAGLILVDGDSTLHSRNGATFELGICGGTIRGEPGARLQSDFFGVFKDVLLDGDFTIGPNLAGFEGTLNHTGVLTIESEMKAFGTVEMVGDGELVLNDASMSGSFVNHDTLIRGCGEISATLTNHHLIRVENGPLALASCDNYNGQIEIESGQVLLNGGSAFATGIFGGVVFTEESAYLGDSSVSSFFGDLIFEGDFKLFGSQTSLTGAIENHGRIEFDESNQNLFIYADTLLDGGGEIVFNDPIYHRVTGGIAMLTNLDHTLKGQGFIDVEVMNFGRIHATGPYWIFFNETATLMTGGTVAVELDGLDFSESGSILLQFSSSFDGNLELIGNQDLIASIGDRYSILYGPGASNGQFQQIDQSNSGGYLFDVIYGNEVEVEVIGYKMHPSEFQVVNGQIATGSEADLFRSDNTDLSLRRNNQDLQSRVVVEFESICPIQMPTTLAYTIEGSVFARSSINQTVELFNYQTGEFEIVDVRSASRFSDSVVEVTVPGNLARFVEQRSRSVRSRIQFDSSQARQQFSANLDQVFWTVQ